MRCILYFYGKLLFSFIELVSLCSTICYMQDIYNMSQSYLWTILKRVSCDCAEGKLDNTCLTSILKGHSFDIAPVTSPET